MAGGGGVVGGGITGVKAAVAGMLAVATVGVSAGGVAVLNQSHAHPVPPPQIAAAGAPGSTTAHGEDSHEQAWGEATDASDPTDTGAGAESGDGNGNAYSNGSSGDGGGDNEAETSAGAGTQFASLTSPAAGAGAPAADTTTPDGTAWHQPAASETSDDTSQPVSLEPRDN
jgi:hypothetical protein